MREAVGANAKALNCPPSEGSERTREKCHPEDQAQLHSREALLKELQRLCFVRRGREYGDPEGGGRGTVKAGSRQLYGAAKAEGKTKRGSETRKPLRAELR